MKATFALSLVAALAATTAYAEDGTMSFSLEGGYLLEGSTNHLHFGEAIFPGQSDSDHQDGVYGAVGIRYSLPTYFIGVKYDYADVDRGAPFDTDVSPEMGIMTRVFDLEYGRGFNLAGHDAVWTAGLRYADMNFTTDNFSAGSGPEHSFTGLGLRVGLETDFALSQPGWSVLADGGLSVLDGSIRSGGRGSWISSDATNISTTAVGVDLKLGVEFKQNDKISWVAGYQAKYWSNVNVGISDNTDQGGNEGKSDILLHGPFIGMNLTM